MRTTLSLSACLFTAAVALAQVPATPAQPGNPPQVSPRPVPGTPVQPVNPNDPNAPGTLNNQIPNADGMVVPYRAKQILGTTVNLQGGNQIGTVDDIVFSDDGQIEYLIVANESRQLVTVPFQAAKFDMNAKAATLGIDATRYRTIPTYTPSAYPQFYTPGYRTEIYRAYGLTPRDLRRPILPRR